MSAAVDRRRFNGPETSSPVKYSEEKEPVPLLHPATGARSDGRQTNDFRPIFLKTGLVPQANGSAYIETGKAKIICAVYGPHPTRKDAPYSPKANLNVEVKFAPFACPGRRRTPGKDTESASLSSQLLQSLLPALRLDLLPKSAIDLFVTILECDGPLDSIAPGITAASVALADSGVQMYGLVVSTCTAFVNIAGNTTALVDPTYTESLAAKSILTVSSIPALESSANITFQGAASRQQLKEAIDEAQAVCEQIHRTAANALLETQITPAVAA